ncbi:PAS domain-containing sensor histidine kinase [Bradymonas sediminis]|nr:ATP-binding protein [Bradymonas sediminis]TDP71901.1 PAS domain S-box-containing protein [Bradymonas sediminis]
MSAAFIDYFIPESSADVTGVDVKHARIGITVVFVIIFWAFLGGLLAIATGLYGSSIAMFLGIVVVGSAPFVLRSTGNLSLTGHLVLGPVFAVLLWTIYEGGGLYSSSTVWLPVLPLLASLFQGNRTARVWLAIVVFSFLGILGATLAGVPFPEISSQREADIQFGLGLVGVGVTSFVLLQLKDNIQSWLAGTLRQKEAETRAVLETAPDGILTVHIGGEILNANPAAGCIFERDPQQIIGRNIAELVTSLDAGALSRIVEGQTFGDTLEHCGQRESTGEFPLEIAFGRHEDRLVLVFRDITERKVVNEQLRSARDAAIEASQAKSEFLARMSHELRTPLNAVIGYSEMIQEDIGLMQEDEVDNVAAVTGFLPDVERIRSAGKHLLALVSDILELSKVEAGQMDVYIEEFDVVELVQDIENTLAPLAIKSGDTFRVQTAEGLGTMRSDATKVRQILYNLLSNAFKFTKDGEVSLRVFAPATTPRAIHFEIKDTGVGMSSEEIGRVFEAFAQADSSTTRQYGGTGLGLTITRHFCALLGGSIDVESTPGNGSLFRIRLAADMRPAPATPAVLPAEV